MKIGAIFAGVKHIFENDDLTLVNLETTFTTAKKKLRKPFDLRGSLLCKYFKRRQRRDGKYRK